MKIKYEATGVPRNVPKKEYSRHTFFVFATFACLGMGLITAIALMTGKPIVDVERVQEIPFMTAPMVRDLKSAPKTAFKFEGILTGDKTVAMKDDQSPVLFGRYDVILRGTYKKGSKKNKKFRHVLGSWKGRGNTLILKMGDEALPLKIDDKTLPVSIGKKARAKLQYEGSLRNRGKAVTVEYAGEVYPLEKYGLEKQDFVTTEVERFFIKEGVAVLVIAHIEKGSAGWQLTGPGGVVLEMHRGHQVQFNARAQKAWLSLLGFGFLCFVVGGLLFKKVQKDRADFARRSNE